MTRAGLQCAQMLCALGLGLSLGIIYDFYRIFLKKNHGALWCWLGDFLWWAVALGWTFWLLIRISWAELRIPIVLAVFLGIVVYLYYFSPVLSEVYKKSAGLLKKICRRCWNIAVKIVAAVFSPLVLLSSFIYKILVGLLAVFCKIFGGMLGFGKKFYNKKSVKKKVRRAAKAQKRAAKKQKKSELKMQKKQQKAKKLQKEKQPTEES